MLVCGFLLLPPSGPPVEYFVDWEKTSLKPYVDLLDKHALSLMEEVRKEKRKTGIPLSNTFFFR